MRTVLTVVMNVLIALAVLLTLRMVLEFFGGLAGTGPGRAIIAVTDLMTLPLGLRTINTPYGGVFTIDVALTVVGILVLEWILSVVRAQT
jgi:hypothetical protein